MTCITSNKGEVFINKFKCFTNQICSVYQSLLIHPSCTMTINMRRKKADASMLKVYLHMYE